MEQGVAIKKSLITALALAAFDVAGVDGKRTAFGCDAIEHGR